MNEKSSNHRLSTRWLIIIVLLQIISRIPFIPLGYGADDDAWRVARAAKEMLTTWHYSVSRFPGYPLFEIVNIPLVAFGKWYFSNSATAVVSAITLYIFFKIISILDLQYKKEILILFAFFPMLWSNSANTMDYMWGLMFILLGFYLLLTDRIIPAAVALGVSVGFRVSNAVFVLPYSTLLVLSGRKKQVLTFINVSAATGLIAFSPPLIKFGVGTLHKVYRPRFFELAHIPYYLAYSMGLVTSTILAAGIVRYARSIARSIRDKDVTIITSLLSVLIVLIIFFTIPQEKAYLIPAFPFLFIIIARTCSKRFIVIFTIAALAYGFIRIEVKDDRSVDVIRVRPHFSYGLVDGGYRFRKAQLELREKLAPFLIDKAGRDRKTLFISGWLVGLPQLIDNENFERITLEGVRAELYRLKGTETVVLAGAIAESQYDYFAKSGYRLLFLEGSIRYSRNAFGFEVDTSKEEVITIQEIYDYTSSRMDI